MSPSALTRVSVCTGKPRRSRSSPSRISAAWSHACPDAQKRSGSRPSGCSPPSVALSFCTVDAGARHVRVVRWSMLSIYTVVAVVVLCRCIRSVLLSARLAGASSSCLSRLVCVHSGLRASSFDADRLDLSTLIFTYRLYLVPGLPKGKPSSAGRPARAEREFRGDARSIAGDRRRLGPLLSGLVLSC